MAAKGKKINAKQAGSPGNNLAKNSQPTYLKVGGAPAYSPEPPGTVDSNPKNDVQAVDGALKIASKIGIIARKGGNQARKCDIIDDNGLMKAVKSNSWVTKDRK